MTRHHRQNLVQVFRIPALLALLSLFGLGASLVGDGAWDVGGALALLVPAGVGLVKLTGPFPTGRLWPGSAVPVRQRGFS